MHNKTKVLLPAWIFEQAQDEKELKRFVLKYMNKSYPGYTVLKVKEKFAICEINRQR